MGPERQPSRRRARGGVAFPRRPSGSVHPAPEQGPRRPGPSLTSGQGHVAASWRRAPSSQNWTWTGGGACSCPGAVYLGCACVHHAHHRSCPRGCCAATARVQPNVVAAHRQSACRSASPCVLSRLNEAQNGDRYMGLAGRIISHLVSPSEGADISHLVSTRTDRRRTGGYRRGSLQPHARWSVWEGAHCSRRPSGGFSGGPAKAGFPCKPSSDPRIPSVLVTAPYAMHQWVIARHLFCSVRGILLSDAVLGQA